MSYFLPFVAVTTHKLSYKSQQASNITQQKSHNQHHVREYPRVMHFRWLCSGRFVFWPSSAFSHEWGGGAHKCTAARKSREITTATQHISTNNSALVCTSHTLSVMLMLPHLMHWLLCCRMRCEEEGEWKMFNMWKKAVDLAHNNENSISHENNIIQYHKYEQLNGVGMMTVWSLVVEKQNENFP